MDNVIVKKTGIFFLIVLVNIMLNIKINFLKIIIFSLI